MEVLDLNGMGSFLPFMPRGRHDLGPWLVKSMLSPSSPPWSGASFNSNLPLQFSRFAELAADDLRPGLNIANISATKAPIPPSSHGPPCEPSEATALTNIGTHNHDLPGFACYYLVFTSSDGKDNPTSMSVCGVRPSAIKNAGEAPLGAKNTNSRCCGFASSDCSWHNIATPVFLTLILQRTTRIGGVLRNAYMPAVKLVS